MLSLDLSMSHYCAFLISLGEARFGLSTRRSAPRSLFDLAQSALSSAERRDIRPLS